MKVAIDPGHGGRDPGAVAGGVSEKDIVLEYSRELAARFSKAGDAFLLIRNTDDYVPLAERAKLADEWQADCLLSIHANASSRPAANGAWVIYDDRSVPANGPALARAVFDELRLIPGVEDADADVEVFADGTAWVGHRQLTVISRSRCPAVLIELGFLTNAADVADLRKKHVREAVCDAIVRGTRSWGFAKGMIPAPAPDVRPVNGPMYLLQDHSPVEVLNAPAPTVAREHESTGAMIERVLRWIAARPEAQEAFGRLGQWALAIVLDRLKGLLK